jgi:nicotinate-nucleotide adenylyltransferase
MGSDNLKSFNLWNNWEELITTWDFLVFPRPGFDFDLKKYGFDNPSYRFKLIQHPLLATTDISSTLIRKRLQASTAIDYLLPEKVCQFIHEHNLYSEKLS